MAKEEKPDFLYYFDALADPRIDRKKIVTPHVIPSEARDLLPVAQSLAYR